MLSPLASRNGWTLAEAAGDATPDRMQRLLNRSTWDPDAVRDDLFAYVSEYLGHNDGVLIVDDRRNGWHNRGVEEGCADLSCANNVANRPPNHRGPNHRRAGQSDWDADGGRYAQLNDGGSVTGRVVAATRSSGRPPAGNGGGCWRPGGWGRAGLPAVRDGEGAARGRTLAGCQQYRLVPGSTPRICENRW
ncbi:hypothetical protein ACGGAQ_30110 [Micromonospora sp. NPDC047557]|uniref:hypothetical protein n=1 Tax=Micromonospora sp. NPDC047557 TaxID=3364250 RepID=UPI00371CCF3B